MILNAKHFRIDYIINSKKEKLKFITLYFLFLKEENNYFRLFRLHKYKNRSSDHFYCVTKK